MTSVQEMEPPTFDPTEEEIEVERQYWSGQDRIAEFESWFVSQADDQEHDYSDECGCDECKATYDEYDEMNHQYEIAIRGF